MRIDRASGSKYTDCVMGKRGVLSGLVLAFLLSPVAVVAQDGSSPPEDVPEVVETPEEVDVPDAVEVPGPAEVPDEVEEPPAPASTEEGGSTQSGDAETASKRADALRREDREALRVGKIDAARVPVKEKQERVDVMLAEQRLSLKRGTELLQEAREANDIVQLNCVNEKLTQIKGLLKLTENASRAMYDAIGAADDPTVNHEYTKIFVATQRSRDLRAEAEQCVGERSVYSGETEVEVEIDSDISPRDPTIPLPPPPGPQTPAVGSEF